MKIGILTFHSSINTGSILQAFCVYNILKTNFPNSHVEIINLIPLNREISEWRFIKLKPPFIKLKAINKYFSSRSFIAKNIKLSKRVYYTNLNKQIEYINKQNYDFIITGSDTVWMHSVKFKWQLPTIYYLHQSMDAKKISIAASIDPLIDKAPFLMQKDSLKAIFDSYSLLTVRDSITENMLNKIGVEKSERIADPTFLYDFEKHLNIKSNKDYNTKKRNVLVWLSGKKLEELTKQFLKKILNNPIFLSTDIPLPSKECYILNDLNQYANIDIIITDRFHRSIFALKLSSALVINVERESKNPFPESKGRDLFNCIGTPQYCIRYDTGKENEYLNSIKELINEETYDKYIYREKMLKIYINENKNKWQNLISKTDKDII